MRRPAGWMYLSIGSSILVIILWWVMGDYAASQGSPGIYGDQFGAVNALFSGLAFAGIVITISLQWNELRLQRQELRETREELKGQREQLALQAKTMLDQAQEGNFFRLFTIFRDYARTIDHPGRPETEVGVEYWRVLVKLCHNDASMIAARSNGDDIDKSWAIHFRNWEPTLGPYFATFAELLNVIAAGNSDQIERWSKLLRAQLSPHEMVVIFYQGLSPWGRLMIKGYIEEFGLFKYFPTTDDYPERKINHWYAASAFTK